jgi:hypothetical protein
MRNARILKSYFRNNPRYGRTTTLLVDDKPVYVAMGAATKTQMVRDYLHAARSASFGMMVEIMVEAAMKHDGLAKQIGGAA